MDGKWIWGNNRPMTFVNWQDGEPKNPGSYRYVAMVVNIAPGSNINWKLFKWVTLTGEEKYPGVARRIIKREIDTYNNGVNVIVSF